VSAFEDLRARYFVLADSGGSIGRGDPGIIRYAGCEVIPHVGGASYFRALRDAIVQPDVTYVYLAGWLCDPDFQIVPGTKLADLLRARSKAGVDVRVLGWVMAPEVLNNPAVTSGKVNLGGIDTTVNEPTMKFVQGLRLGEPTLVTKALLNVIAHPAGAVHTKFALVGRPSGDVGFTGGIDAYPDRVTPAWHDVQAEVRGQATQGMYDLFRAMWNENISRSPVTVRAGSTSVVTRAPSSPGLGGRSVPGVLAGTKHLQGGITVPRMSFSMLASMGGSVSGTSLPKNREISFAPNGQFDVKRLWHKAVRASDTYIYMEDQSFCSDEIFDWVNATLKARPAVKVVLLNGRQDPNNPNPDPLLKLMRRSINDHLLKGLSKADIDNRVAFVLNNAKTVHTKSTIVDDNWAMIGSANVMRRSLYTDLEHVVTFMDEAGTGVPAYRRALFNAHLGNPGAPTAAADLARWFSLPYHDPATPRPVSRLRLPFTTGFTLTSSEETMIDELMDVDSRNAWGSGLASLAMSAAGAGS
jgi:phosphatidylserine/phosphatidylglycerophosphate/cardiolipin synthase-like enzyme